MSRRSFVTRTAVLGGAGAAGLLAGGTSAEADTSGTSSGGTSSAASAPTFGPVTVTPSDARYPQMVSGFNQRFVGSPSSVVLVSTTGQVVNAVAQAVSAGKQIAVRGGGHCYSGFVYNSSVQVVIDLTMMNQVYFDPSRNAFCVQGGAQLGDIYETLFRAYGVTLPGGHCPSTGIGGHATGGGHGLLSRKFGLITDFIQAVEIVTVDANKNVNVVIAQRGGQNSDLWWAVSGGGGGNFGIITRYWFSTPGVTSTQPGQLLPTPPANVLISTPVIPWSSLTQAQFSALVGNLCTFFAQNSAPSSPYASLASMMTIPHVSSGPITWITHVDATVPGATTLLSNFHTALTANTGISPSIPYRTIPWMAAEETINTATPLIETNATLRNFVKCAYLVTPFTSDQISTIYANMTRTDYSNPLPSILQLGAMAGGAINAVPQTATAISYRNSTLFSFWQTYWADASDDAVHMAWLRQLYSQVFASTGGMPVPGASYAGSTINLPDPDTQDTTINTSGVPWSTIYYGVNYPQLQQAKAKWDPTNFFSHPMSITAG